MTTSETLPVFVSDLDLQDELDRMNEIQSQLYHIREVFQTFARDEIDPNAMRSISAICVRSFEQLAHFEAEQSVKFLMSLEKKMAALEPNRDWEIHGTLKPQPELEDTK
tara:strand:+ start:233 stop:559 length:327 start_codon:yes stop_codon:yes gene_type:complete